MPGLTVTKGAIALIIGFVLMSCAESAPVTGGSSSGGAAGSVATGPDMRPIIAGTALPAGYQINLDRTIVFGTDESWTGRLSYTTSTNAGDVFDFLHKEMDSRAYLLFHSGEISSGAKSSTAMT